MSTLRIFIETDGQRRQFYGQGDGPVLVAAFRAWLAGPDTVFDSAVGADELDKLSGVVLASAAKDSLWKPLAWTWVSDPPSRRGDAGGEDRECGLIERPPMT